MKEKRLLVVSEISMIAIQKLLQLLLRYSLLGSYCIQNEKQDET